MNEFGFEICLNMMSKLRINLVCELKATFKYSLKSLTILIKIPTNKIVAKNIFLSMIF